MPKRVGKTGRNVFTISCANPLAIGQARWLLDGRGGCRFGYVASAGLPITTHFSPFTTPRLACFLKDLFLHFITLFIYVILSS
jgi:hypothetical protein